MSTYSVRALLSKSVTAIKEKLGISSFTWDEYETKLSEAMAGGESDVDLATFIADGSNADAVVVAAKSATKIRDYAFENCIALTNASFPAATKVGDYAFYSCTKLASVNFPVAASVGTYSFGRCNLIASVNFPVVTSVGNYAFYYCAKLASANFPETTSVGHYAFRNCSGLTDVDFPLVTSIGNYAFQSCAALTALIIRTTAKACTISSTTPFASTPIASGTGYIYVPSALIDTYKTATNWVTYAAQFRALEDYTVDGTTTGELDSTKI